MSRAASVIVVLVVWIYRVYHATLRIRVLMPDGSTILPRDYGYGREIFALSERDVLVMAGLMTGRRFTVLVAHGRDGDWAGAALEQIGCIVVRGSSRGRGTGALIALIRRLIESDAPGGVVVDGPLGPSGRARGGAIVCGCHTGRPVRPLATAATRELVFRATWSGIFLPLPFTRTVVVLEEPMKPEPNADIGAATMELTDRLARARGRARAAVRSVPRDRDRDKTAARMSMKP